MERRFCADGVKIETRSEGVLTLAGYASVFYRAGEPGTEFQLHEDMVERIHPTAFARALRDRHDVRALFNHDPSLLLGRSTAGTLRLSTDSRGLRYEIDLPDTSVGRDVAESIKRGDITGSSFAFTPAISEFSESGGMTVRTIRDVALYDVGPVTYPAYEGTTAGMRSKELDAELDAWRKRKRAVAVRLRLLELDKDA